MARRSLTDAEVAALREQRDFLLRSLEDLEAEHDAGDVDDEDHATLLEDYTVRAAQVIRAIEAHAARVPEGRSRPWWRPVGALAAVIVFAVGAGALVAQTAGRRQSGDGLTGDIRTSTRTELIRASDATWAGEFGDAIEIYEAILSDQPENVEAMTYLGWAHVLAGEDLMRGVETLVAATQLNPEYADAHALLAVTYFRVGRESPEVRDLFFGRARDQLAVLDDLRVSGEMEALLAPIRQELAA